MPLEFDILRHRVLLVLHFIYVHPAMFVQFFLQRVHPNVPANVPSAILLYSECQGRLQDFRAFPHQPVCADCHCFGMFCIRA